MQYKKIQFFFFVFIAFFGFFSVSKANQLIKTDSFTNTAGYQVTEMCFSGTTEPIDHITFNFSTTGSTDMEVYLQSFTSLSNCLTNTNATTIDTGYFTNWTNNVDFTISTSTAGLNPLSSPNPDLYYRYIFLHSSGTLTFNGLNNNPDSNTACASNTSGSYATCPNDFDFYYYINDESVSFVDDSISIVFPLGNTSYFGDFSNWQVSYLISATSSYFISVDYGNDVNANDYRSSWGGATYGSMSTSSLIYIPKNFSLNASSTYYAYASVRDVFNDVIVSSTLINFQFGGAFTRYTGSPISLPISFASTSMNLPPDDVASSWYVDCTDATGWDVFSLSGMGCWFKKSILAVVYHVFMPHDFSFDYFYASLDVWKNVFPYSVFFSLAESVNNFVSSPLDTPQDIVLNWNMAGKNISIDILTSSTLSNFVGESNKTLIFDFLSACLWILLAFVIFKFVIK